MKFYSNLHSKYSSFALIEVLVVVSIIIILSVIVLTNYEFGGYQFAVQRSAHKVSQDLRRAEEMAMSAKSFNGTVPLGGYGIHFTHSTSTYILFADLNGNGYYYTEAGGYETDETVEIIDIEESVEIGQICQWPDEFCDCGPRLSITFIPPDPIINFNSVRTATCSAEITFISKKTSDQILLYLRPTGLIEIE